MILFINCTSYVIIHILRLKNRLIIFLLFLYLF
jgi:hypothetical protein